MGKSVRRRRGGFTLIELLIVVTIIGLLAMIAIPNITKASRKSRYARAGADSKTATTSAITYVLDKGVYPTSFAALRSGGYGSVGDLDPWQVAYQLSPVLTGGGPPVSGEDVYVYSKGASGAAGYPTPFTPDTGDSGSAGYSSIYGAWTGS